MKNSSISRSEIGFGSYLSGNTSLSRVKIGRYCSIGQNVKNSFGIHPTDFISSHPAFYSTKKQAGFSFVDEDKIEEHKYVDKERRFLNIIGNDVWIGNNVSLMDGIAIGDGAIIGTGAVVTKDIAPYTIVGGIPARKIRTRFSEDVTEFLVKFQWWNKDEKWIQEHANLFDDIVKFMNYIEGSFDEV
ncbi:CatB-related O-acetyltransferase [Balneola sp. EhC07]|uniref:CatB-related O-acetyltransferase n=1 Tax=Balneola sp. EhC07 TaxID=1849360 RepID=UPI001F37B981|nr:CatB-related O-acetyltransferase [Balneola sp. EhC07]